MEFCQSEKWEPCNCPPLPLIGHLRTCLIIKGRHWKEIILWVPRKCDCMGTSKLDCQHHLKTTFESLSASQKTPLKK